MTQPPPSRLRPFSPMRFGRYTLVARLAQGGMGELFLAQLDGGGEGFQKLCVIKRMLPQLAHDPDFVERFTNEARVLVKLSHGSIAQVLELGDHEGTPFLALEYVDGKDLRRVSVRAREQGMLLPPGFVLQVMCRVLEALAYAHRKKDDEGRELLLVHRDISPPNVLVSYEGEVKVIDFGLARSRLSAARTNPRSLLGKFLYMSPEQALHRPVDRRSDLYAVGLCLYELLAGAHPFEQLAPAELMSRVAKPSIPPLRTVAPSCPPPLADVVMRALEVDPDARYQTADELRVALIGLLASIEPAAGAEHVSRVMHRLFGPEFQLERRLLAAAREPQPMQPAPVSRARSETAVLPAWDAGVSASPSPATVTRAAPPAPGLARSASSQALPAVGGGTPFPGNPAAGVRGGHAQAGPPPRPPPLPGASVMDAAPRTLIDLQPMGARPSGAREAPVPPPLPVGQMTPPPLPGSASRSGAGPGAPIATVGAHTDSSRGAPAPGGTAERRPLIAGGSSRGIAAVAPFGSTPERSGALPSLSSQVVTQVPARSEVAPRVPVTTGSSPNVAAVPGPEGLGGPVFGAPAPAKAPEAVTLVPGASEVRPASAVASGGVARPPAGTSGGAALLTELQLEEPVWFASESAMTELSSLPGPAALGFDEDPAAVSLPAPTPVSTAARGTPVQASPLSFEPTPMVAPAASHGSEDPFNSQTRRVEPTAEVLRGLLDGALPIRESGVDQAKAPQSGDGADDVLTGGGLSAGFAPPSVAPLSTLGSVSPPPPPERALQISAEFLLPPEEEPRALSELEPSTAAALAAWFEAEPSAELAEREPPVDTDPREATAALVPGRPPPGEPAGDSGRTAAARTQTEQGSEARAQGERAKVERAPAEGTKSERAQPAARERLASRVTEETPGGSEAEAAGRRASAKPAAATRNTPSTKARAKAVGSGLDDLLHEATTQKGALTPPGPLDPDATDPSYRLTRPAPDDRFDERGRGTGLWWGLAILVLLGAGLGAGWEFGRQHPDRVPELLTALYPSQPAVIAEAEAVAPGPVVAPETALAEESGTEAPIEVPAGDAAGRGTVLAVDTMEDAETLLVPLKVERTRRARGTSESAANVPPGALGREWTSTLELFQALEAERTCEGSLSLMCKRFARVRTRVEAATTDDPNLRRQVRELKRALQQMER